MKWGWRASSSTGRRVVDVGGGVGFEGEDESEGESEGERARTRASEGERERRAAVIRELDIINIITDIRLDPPNRTADSDSQQMHAHHGRRRWVCS